MILEIGNQRINLSERTYIMGILNVTPDSFYDGGQHFDPEQAVQHALQMVHAGADWIDIGGESTRPGADVVSETEELNRVIPVIQALRLKSEVPISIDTYKARVAAAALRAGANLVNDISALRFDPAMKSVVREFQAPVILMHIQGTPKNMQQQPVYQNVIQEVTAYLQAQIEYAVSNGIERERIIVDPGIGFGKSVKHNYQILNQLDVLQQLGRPILIGVSRKSFLNVSQKLTPAERLEGTAAANAVAIIKGAHIIRVHDVQAMVRVSQIVDLIRNSADSVTTSG